MVLKSNKQVNEYTLLPYLLCEVKANVKFDISTTRERGNDREADGTIVGEVVCQSLGAFLTLAIVVGALSLGQLEMCLSIRQYLRCI